jgi:beta-1,4-mannosyl-glycoprotein beta-1,4-N-acetylglucosaminyltransferase
MYNGEIDMLNFRLHELNDFVDYFIITECVYTFKGDKKELQFPKIESSLSAFKNKIIYLPNSTLYSSTDAWANEIGQRKHLQVGLQNLNDNDLVLLSDVDEIPDTNVLKQIRGANLRGQYKFLQHFYYYNIKCRCKGLWSGTVITDAITFKTIGSDMQQLRDSRFVIADITLNGGVTGWHFSYFGNIQAIIKKIKSFSHQEYNNEKYIDPIKIKETIEQGKDIFFRSNMQFEHVQNEQYLPKHIHMLK